MKFRFLFILMTSALLSACQIPLQPDADSPFYQIPRGATLVLNRDITIPAGTVRVIYQNGREVYAPDQYEPFCKFEILPLKDEPQQVKADEFLIYRSGRGEGALLVGLETLPRYARAGVIWLDNDPPSPRIYGTYLFLRSEQQPDVYRLLCGYLQDPADVPRHLTINQIRTALGGTFTLQVPQLP
jgi:hypothetical protein